MTWCLLNMSLALSRTFFIRHYNQTNTTFYLWYSLSMRGNLINLQSKSVDSFNFLGKKKHVKFLFLSKIFAIMVLVVHGKMEKWAFQSVLA